MSQAARSSRLSLGTVLKTICALGLLTWVAMGLDWTDRLEYCPDPGHPETLLSATGTIEGNWRAEEILFLLDQEQPIGSLWPGLDRSKQMAGEPLLVTRRQTASAGYAWQPGMPRVFMTLRSSGLVLALGSLLLGVLFGVTRWWRLLNLAGCPSTWHNTLRLAFLGLFFNLALPGLTGGDLPKAVLAVREHPERRADALATVVIDRLIGLWALVSLATAVGWGIGGGFEPLRWPSTLICLALTAGLFVVLAPAARRALGLDRWIERLPQGKRLKKLEQAALMFRGRRGELVVAVLLSFGNHLSVIGGIFAIGRAFGDELPFWTYLGIVPVANLVTALPLSIGGWGVGEAAFGTLFEMMGATAAIGVAVSITFRLCTVVLGLIGGAFLLTPGGAQTRREALAVEQDPESSF